MEVNEVRRMKGLERENNELKKMLAESLLVNRVLEAVWEKSAERGVAAGTRPGTDRRRRVFGASGVPDSETGPVYLPVSRQATDQTGIGPGAVFPRDCRHGPHRGHVSTVDFIADEAVHGCARRMLPILDERTRECHVLRVDQALKSKDVLDWLGRATREHGVPGHPRSDSGPESIVKAAQRWLAEQKIKTLCIEPGSRWQNVFVERFHGRFRDECLNREQFHPPPGLKPAAALQPPRLPELGHLRSKRRSITTQQPKISAQTTLTPPGVVSMVPSKVLADGHLVSAPHIKPPRTIAPRAKAVDGRARSHPQPIPGPPRSCRAAPWRWSHPCLRQLDYLWSGKNQCSVTATTHREQRVGWAPLWPTSFSQCQQRSHFSKPETWPDLATMASVDSSSDGRLAMRMAETLTASVSSVANR